MSVVVVVVVAKIFGDVDDDEMIARSLINRPTIWSLRWYDCADLAAEVRGQFPSPKTQNL